MKKEIAKSFLKDNILTIGYMTSIQISSKNGPTIGNGRLPGAVQVPNVSPNSQGERFKLTITLECSPDDLKPVYSELLPYGKILILKME